jgi:hypothetical protein
VCVPDPASEPDAFVPEGGVTCSCPSVDFGGQRAYGLNDIVICLGGPRRKSVKREAVLTLSRVRPDRMRAPMPAAERREQDFIQRSFAADRSNA